MYLAPLNYDHFFKKVFSSKAIAKRFLEDFLEVEIQEIEILKEKHKVTDNTYVVEFDYLCKINDSFIIIDMQQWYKADVIKRFYIYHAVNATLQLADVKLKRVSYDEMLKKIKTTYDYKPIEPVLTLIWMVDDRLGFDENYISYSLIPEQVTDFIYNKTLWQAAKIEELKKEKNKLINILQNKTKNIDFLTKNKLIFLFQKNIVENKHHKKYAKWFTFAAKTRNKKNTKQDFIEYEEDEIFAQIMHRICKEDLTNEENEYIESEVRIKKYVNKMKQGYYDRGVEKGKKEGKREGKKEGERNKQLEIAKSLLDVLDAETIALKIGLTIEEVIKL